MNEVKKSWVGRVVGFTTGDTKRPGTDKPLPKLLTKAIFIQFNDPEAPFASPHPFPQAKNSESLSKGQRVLVTQIPDERGLLYEITPLSET